MIGVDIMKKNTELQQRSQWYQSFFFVKTTKNDKIYQSDQDKKNVQITKIRNVVECIATDVTEIISIVNECSEQLYDKKILKS